MNNEAVIKDVRTQFEDIVLNISETSLWMGKCLFHAVYGYGDDTQFIFGIGRRYLTVYLNSDIAETDLNIYTMLNTTVGRIMHWDASQIELAAYAIFHGE